MWEEWQCYGSSWKCQPPVEDKREVGRGWGRRGGGWAEKPSAREIGASSSCHTHLLNGKKRCISEPYLRRILFWLFAFCLFVSSVVVFFSFLVWWILLLVLLFCFVVCCWCCCIYLPYPYRHLKQYGLFHFLIFKDIIIDDTEVQGLKIRTCSWCTKYHDFIDCS